MRKLLMLAGMLAMATSMPALAKEKGDRGKPEKSERGGDRGKGGHAKRDSRPAERGERRARKADHRPERALAQYIRSDDRGERGQDRAEVRAARDWSKRERKQARKFAKQETKRDRDNRKQIRSADRQDRRFPEFIAQPRFRDTVDSYAVYQPSYVSRSYGSDPSYYSYGDAGRYYPSGDGSLPSGGSSWFSSLLPLLAGALGGQSLDGGFDGLGSVLGGGGSQFAGLDSFGGGLGDFGGIGGGGTQSLMTSAISQFLGGDGLEALVPQSDYDLQYADSDPYYEGGPEGLDLQSLLLDNLGSGLI